MAAIAAGLLEASVQVLSSQRAVLYVAYDDVAPFPLRQKIPISIPFATAMLLTPEADTPGVLAGLALAPHRGGVESRLTDPQLEALRLANPCARGLPLLQSLSMTEPRRVLLPHQPQQMLAIEISPC